MRLRSLQLAPIIGAAAIGVGLAVANFVSSGDAPVARVHAQAAPQATLTIVKEMVNDNGGTGVAGDFTIGVYSAGNLVTSVTGSDTGAAVLLDAGTYVVTEGPHAGYTNSIRGACDGDGSITVVAGQSYTCVVSNNDMPTSDPAHLTVVKEMVNDNGGTGVAGDFQISVMQNGSAVHTDAGSATGVTYDLPAGAYSVVEGAHAGYASSVRGACDGDGSVTLAAGQSYTCVVSNNDVPTSGDAHLTVVKEMVNDNGGTGVASDFQISVMQNGSAVHTDAGSATGVTYDLPAGAYTVVEGAHAGYASSVRGACDGDGSVTLAAGQSYTCTVSNNDMPTSGDAHLTVVKEMVNDNGGTGVAGDFQISVMQNGSAVHTDAGSATGVTYDLPAGAYMVVEGAHAGYASSIRGACDGDGSVTLAAGQSYTCVVSNNDNAAPASITVIKDAGGAVGQSFHFASPGLGNGAFDLDDDPGTAMSNTITFSDVAPGTYSITEAAYDGWRLISALCSSPTKGPMTPSSTEIIVAPGDDIICTFVNRPTTSQAPGGGQLTIIKNFVAAPFGFAMQAAFTTTGAGLSGFSLGNGMAQSFSGLNAGTFTVTEGAVAGWNLVSVFCDQGASWSMDMPTNTVTVNLAQDANVTCMFNNAAPGSIVIGSNTPVATETTPAATATTPAATATTPAATVTTPAITGNETPVASTPAPATPVTSGSTGAVAGNATTGGNSAVAGVQAPGAPEAGTGTRSGSNGATTAFALVGLAAMGLAATAIGIRRARR